MNRVTNMSSSKMLLNNINAKGRALVGAQERIASGKQIQRPSDNPAQVLSALDYRGQLRRNEQQERNSNDARTWLDSADRALTHTVERTERIRSLMLGALNASSDHQARMAYAAEIDTIREELLQTANTQHLSRPIFSGTEGVASAYDANGHYLGNAGVVERTVADGVTIQVNRSGPAVFGDEATPANPGDALTTNELLDGNLFQVLTGISEALRSGDMEAASAGLTKLDAATDRIEAAQVELGARSRQVEEIGFRNLEINVQLKAALAEVEDIDMAESLIEVQVQEMAYQAALSVTGKVIQPTLLDFLR